MKTRRKFFIIYSSILILFVFVFNVARAEELVDSDNDGYYDSQEIQNGYSPFNKEPIKITESDVDDDGLNDYLELKYRTNPAEQDSDGDGHKDGTEIDWAYDPLSTSTKKLERKIEINLKKQELIYLVSGQVWKEFSVSSGKASTPTPQGTFTIVNKSKKAWSKTYGLWMPYWLGLDRGGVGIHELPVWPSGYREGENHLGTPVSHGCVRLGIGPAQYLFDRLDVGTEVTIK